MFDPAEAKGNPAFFDELRADIREEVEKLGPIQSVAIFENNPEGVAVVKFDDPESAEKCLKLMNGRWFAKRQIIAEWYDGVTNYKVKENTKDELKRIDEFGDWLEQQSSSDSEEELPASPLREDS